MGVASFSIYMLRNKWRFPVCFFLLLFFPAGVFAHDPDDPSTFVARAVAYGAEGKFALSAGYFDKAPAGAEQGITEAGRDALRAVENNLIEPHAAMFVFKGLRSWRDDRLSRAREQFIAAAGISPDYAGAYRLLGSLSEQMGDLPQAAIWFSKALDADPLDPRTMFSLGRLSFLQGEHERALGLYRKAVERGMSPGRTHLAIGECYNALGLPLKALEAFNRAYGEGSDPAETYLGMGNAYRLMDDSAPAARCYEKAKRAFEAQGRWAQVAAAQELLELF